METVSSTVESSISTQYQLSQNPIFDLWFAAGVNDSTANPMNFSHSKPSERKRNESLAKVQISVLSAIFVMAVFGNFIVATHLVALCRRTKKLNRMNNMALHLCCADLFVAFGNILPQIFWIVTVRFLGGNALCKIVKFIQIAAMFTSSYVLLTTAIDRYIAICHPFHFHSSSTNRIHYLVVGAWVVSFLLSTPQLFLFSYQKSANSGLDDCLAQFKSEVEIIYVLWFSLAIYVAPLVVLCVLYCRVCVVVYRSASCLAGSESTIPATERTRVSEISIRTIAYRRGTGGTGSGFVFLSTRRSSAGGILSTVKTVKFTLTVIVSYIVCWGPFFFSMLWRILDRNAPTEAPGMVIAVMLAGLNSCTNPWIYVAFNRDQFVRHDHTQSTWPTIRISKSPLSRTTYRRDTISGFPVQAN